MKYPELQWQGEPIDVQFGFMGLSKNIDNALYWYNYNCDRNAGYTVVAAIRIKQNNHVWYICNDYNQGVNKLRNGGWPNYGHRSLPNDDYVFTRINNKEDIATILNTEFDEAGYAHEQSEREKWMKKNFSKHPDYIKSQALLKMIKSHKSPLFDNPKK